MPPDGTAEVEGIPLLVGKPGPPLYPSGYYTAQVGAGETSNHAVSFLYPNVREGLPNVISCAGQTLALPGGKYKAMHLLTAAGGSAPVTASFGLQYDRETQPLSVTVSRLGRDADRRRRDARLYRCRIATRRRASSPLPVTLGDYALPLDTRPEADRR